MEDELELTCKIEYDQYGKKIAIYTSRYDDKFVEAIKSTDWKINHRHWNGEAWLVDWEEKENIKYELEEWGYNIEIPEEKEQQKLSTKPLADEINIMFGLFNGKLQISSKYNENFASVCGKNHGFFDRNNSIWLFSINRVEELNKDLIALDESLAVPELIMKEVKKRVKEEEVLTLTLKTKCVLSPIKPIFNKHGDFKDWIRQNLGFKHPNYKKMKKLSEKGVIKRDLRNWDGQIVPVEYNWSEGTLTMGLAWYQLMKQKIESMNYNVLTRDTRTPIPLLTKTSWNFPYDLRIPQQEALDYLNEVLPQTWGASFQLPTGVGKTLTALRFIHEKQLTAIILVDTRDLLHQWREDAREILGVPIGIIGDGQFELQEITIATIQSLWSYIKKDAEKNKIALDITDDLIDKYIESGEIEKDTAPIDSPELFKKFSIVILDEMHIGSAKTYLKTIQTFEAIYFIGQSATTWRTDKMHPLMYGVLGKVGYEYSRREAIENGYITDCNVHIIKGIHITEGIAYNSALKEATESEERNRIIAEIVRQAPKPCLVYTDRTKHQNNIADILEEHRLNFEVIRGATKKTKKSDERKRIKEDFGNGKIETVVSTIWKKGTNIPNIKSLVLAYPTKSDVNIIQMIGRALRLHKNKEIAEIYVIKDKGNKYIESWYEALEEACISEGLLEAE